MGSRLIGIHHWRHLRVFFCYCELLEELQTKKKTHIKHITRLVYVQIISVNHKLRRQPALNALFQTGFFLPLEHHDFSDGESPLYGHLRLTTATHLLFKASAGKKLKQLRQRINQRNTLRPRIN